MYKNIAPFVHKVLEQNFDQNLIGHGKKVYSENKFEESFSRGKHLGQFLSTGLLFNKNSIFNIKVQKKNAQSPIDTRCSCALGKKDQSCEHTIAYLIYYLQRYQDKFANTVAEDIPTDPNTASASGHLGDLISQGSDLTQKAYKHFTQLRYQLLGGEVIDYPEQVEDWDPSQKVVISIQTSQLSEEGLLNKSKIRIFTDKERDVSVFDSRYFFSWKTGKLTQVPTDFIKIFKFISNQDQKVNLSFILTYLKESFHDDLYIIEADDKELSFEGFNQLSPIISIKESGQHSLEINLKFENEKKQIRLPEYLKLFSYRNGLLERFTSKSEVSRFIEYYLDSSEDFEHYAYTLNECEQEVEFLKLIRGFDSIYQVQKFPTSQDGDESFLEVSKVDLNLVQKIFSHLKEHLDSNILLQSRFDDFERTYKLVISKTKFKERILSFLASMNELNVPLYYLEKQVKNWSSQVKFQRSFESTNWFDISLSLTPEDLDFIKNLNFDSTLNQMGDDYVLLNDEQSSFIRLVKKFISDKSSPAQKEDDKIKFQLKFHRCQLFDIYQIYQYSGEHLLTQEEKDVCKKLLNLKDIPEYEFPTDNKAVPRDYQVTGYRWLRLLYELKLGACLADDMGLGKTFQTISFLKSIDSNTKKILIVCPVSILSNWQSEFEKFSELKTHLYYGDSREMPEDAKYVVTSYGILRKDFDTVLKDIEWDIFIMDEVQKLKNIKSLGAQAARRVQSQYRICLTGTPVENDISEYYNILDLCVPGIWGSHQQLNYYKKNKNSRHLAKEISKPFVLRRTKKEVLHDLPDKIEQVVNLDFTQNEKENYLKTLSFIKKEMSQTEKGQKYLKVLSNILKLRQLCLFQHIDGIQNSTKIDFLTTNLEQILAEEDNQVLVYSQFTKFLDIIGPAMTQKGWSYSRLDGSCSLKKREKEIEKFKAGKNKVFLISLKAGGLGLNLTEATYVFLMDPWWNPAIESQAIDRAHRIGQKKTLTVYKPIIRDSVEQKVVDLQMKKKELFDDLLGDGLDKVKGGVSFEDFEMILSQ